jgi:hypothetical protein
LAYAVPPAATVIAATINTTVNNKSMRLNMRYLLLC